MKLDNSDTDFDRFNLFKQMKCDDLIVIYIGESTTQSVKININKKTDNHYVFLQNYNLMGGQELPNFLIIASAKLDFALSHVIKKERVI